MMRKLCLLIVFLFILVLASPLPSPAQKSQALPKSVAIGGPSIGTASYVLCVGIAELVSKHTPFTANCESVGGTDANIRMLKTGQIDLTMANSFGCENAFRGVTQFEKEGPIPIRLIAQGNPTLRGLVVTRRSGIKTPADLRGKKLIAKRKAIRELELLADAILKAYGIPKGEVTYLETAETGEVVEALNTGAVGAAIFPAGMVNPNLMELSQSVGITLISFPKDKMEIILKELGPAFYSETIPARTYKDQNEDVYWPSLQMTLSTTERFSEEAAYLVTKTVMGQYDKFKLVHHDATEWTVKNSLKYFSVPFHPGAMKYYKEIKAWTPECERIQKTLLSIVK